MTFAERMATGSVGGILLIVGGRVAWLVGVPFAHAVAAILFLCLGAFCVCVAVMLGDGDGR